MSGDRLDTDTTLFIAVLAGGAVFVVVTGLLVVINEWILNHHFFAAAPIGFVCSVIVMGFLAWRLDRR
jgi:hypothetical protein